ncbi:MAG: glycosyltransferase family 4 protein [Verrucomicrobiae bacterium]
MGKTEAEKPKVCVVVSSPMTVAAFLRDQLRELGSRYDLFVAANAADGGFLDKLGIRARFVSVPVERKIRPLTDLKALLGLFLFCCRERFQIVHSVTPKAGLLAMGAAFLARVPVRVHTFTGQVWATKSGLPRELLRSLDKLIAGFATHVLVDSFSQRQFLMEHGVVSHKKSAVLGSGSISGVDTHRFRPDPEARKVLREENAIPEQDVVFLFVGRMNRDKGIPELLGAFEKVAGKLPGTWLLIVGPDEEAIGSLMDASPVRDRIVKVGYTDTPERYMAAGDVFVLPSHREGFGSTIIEAAAVGLPAVASRIYGLTDAVVDGITGILHDPCDVAGLFDAMARLAEDEDLRRAMGNAARLRAEKDFAMETVTRHVLDFYEEVL